MECYKSAAYWILYRDIIVVYFFPIHPSHPVTQSLHPFTPSVCHWFTTEALGDFTFWRHMEPSYAAISMASYTEAVGSDCDVGWKTRLLA